MPHTVLVVDDDRDIRDSLVDLLEDLGYAALSASNGLDALEILRTRRELPSMILLDLMMPGLDGHGFCAAQRAELAWAAIPVVVLSAYADADAQASALGVECLRKPLTARALVEAVRRYCPG
ncbi:MAG TPA: response regulator [Kofleriaceae bacterium]|nr:response regulator [Kofleriaceae bacterium]